MSGRNTVDAPTSQQIRQDSSIPFLSQIPNDSVLDGDNADDAINLLAGKLVQVVVTASGGSAGATAGLISVQVSDLAGNALTHAVTLALNSSLVQYAGSMVATGTAFFGAATTGTLVVGSGTLYAVVTTDATGLYEGALADAADETAYLSAQTCPGGMPAATANCVVAASNSDDAIWAA